MSAKFETPLWRPPLSGSACGWRWPYVQLRALFHKAAERRREGALALQQLLWAAEDDACAAAETADRAAGYRARSAEAWTDPLAAVLSGGSGYAEGAAGDAASSGGRQRRVPPMKEVQELVAVVCNAALGAETRRAAAQQLTALAAHPMTGASLVASPPLLPLLLRTVTAVAAVRVHEHAVDEEEEANGDGATTAAAAAAARLGRPTLQPGYSSFAPLAHAALELLTTLVMHQRAAQGWLMSPESAEGGGGGSPSKGGAEAAPRVLRLLHLVFHRNVTVRRAVAQTLGRLLFHPCVVDPSGGCGGSVLREQAEEQQQADETKATTTRTATMTRLPVPFVTTYRFPFATAAAAPYATRARPGAAAEAPHDAAEAQRVGRMAALRRLIRSLNDGDHPTAEAARLGELLREAAAAGGGGDDDDDVGSPLPELTADAAATLVACGADEALPRALEALSSARSHAAAAAALAALRLRAASAATATALAAQDWPTAMGRFLATTPASPGDHKLWVQLLELVRKPRRRVSSMSETFSARRLPNPRLKSPVVLNPGTNPQVLSEGNHRVHDSSHSRV